MVASLQTRFLDTVPLFVEFEGVADATRYTPLPDGWAVAAADIVDSTGAIRDGKYKSVNMAGASVISALLNAIDRPNLPFVFGGDGAVVAIPPDGLEKAKAALAAVRRWVAEDLGLDMRASLVPMAAIREAGLDVRVARFQASSEVSYAMFSGGGTSWAEEQMKQGFFAVDEAPAGTRPDLTGLSCRFNPMPSRHGQIVSIIAVPGESGNGTAFRALISDIVALAGQAERDGHPVPPDGPQLGLSLVGLETEARATAHAGRKFLRKLAIVGQYALTVSLYRLGLNLGTFDAKRYKTDIAANTDFRKFDDGLKMTIDVDREQLARIESRLEQAALANVCRYGLHQQDSALMTCIVPTPLMRNHMHFVDGASGGYAQAATALKAKMLLPGARAVMP